MSGQAVNLESLNSIELFRDVPNVPNTTSSPRLRTVLNSHTN